MKPWYLFALILLIGGILAIIVAVIWWFVTKPVLPNGNANTQGPFWLGGFGILLIFLAIIFFAIGFMNVGSTVSETEIYRSGFGNPYD